MNGLQLVQEWLLEEGYVSLTCKEKGYHACPLDYSSPSPVTVCSHGNIIRLKEFPELKVYIVNSHVAVRGKENTHRRSKYGTDVVAFSDPEFFTKLHWMIFLDDVSELGQRKI